MPIPNETEFSVDTRLKVLEQFILALTHDFRTPLTVIRNATYVLRRSNAATPDVTECASLIESEVRDINFMLGRLVEIIRPSQLSWAEAPLSELLEHAAEKVDQEKRAKWRFLVEFEPASIYCDRDRLQNVLQQVFTNSMTATRGVGVVTVRAIRDDSGVTIDISDDGPGVTAEVRGRIFDPFISTKRAGMGLGLTYCRTVLHRHGGDIQLLDSGPPGASFRIKLPRTNALV